MMSASFECPISQNFTNPVFNGDISIVTDVRKNQGENGRWRHLTVRCSCQTKRGISLLIKRRDTALYSVTAMQVCVCALLGFIQMDENSDEYK